MQRIWASLAPVNKTWRCLEMNNDPEEGESPAVERAVTLLQSDDAWKRTLSQRRARVPELEVP